MSTETLAKEPATQSLPAANDHAAWRERLTPDQYRITRRGGTERPFTGPHQDEHRAGVFGCVCCASPLFGSEAKFDSGTGWPSFTAPIAAEAVKEKVDRAFFMRRTEILCATCEAHLGHVFSDGPKPTGLRYCMNGHALTFAPNDDTQHNGEPR